MCHLGVAVVAGGGTTSAGGTVRGTRVRSQGGALAPTWSLDPIIGCRHDTEVSSLQRCGFRARSGGFHPTMFAQL